MVSTTRQADMLTAPIANPTGRDLFTKCQDYRYFRDFADKGLYEYFRPIESEQRPLTRVQGREVIMLGSNSYLGLSHDARVKDAAIAATREYGTGCSGSPLLNGTTDLHLRLEAELCRVTGREACALFSTGFQVNTGVIGALAGPGDVVVSDERNHASIVDGCRLAKGTIRKFRHNHLGDLEQALAVEPDAPKLVVVDGVYSMDGDLADLPGITALTRRYRARLYVDDAHGFGVLGPGGRGTAAHFGLDGEVDLLALTFSKALGTVGGCVLGSEAVIHYIKHRARSYVFSATMPPANAAATLAALQVMAEDDMLRRRLQDNVCCLRQGLSWFGFRLGPTESHILPIQVGDDDLALRFTQRMLEEGVFVPAVTQPGVPAGQAMIRVSVMASHSSSQIGQALATFAAVGREVGLIP